MKYDQLFKMDLNLLKLLKLLGEERNTRRVAERMFVGQSAVSKSLKKLRDIFDDELFIREPHGLRPTPQCEILLQQLPLVFESIDKLLSPVMCFEPDSYQGCITIAVNPVFVRPFMNHLYPRLRSLAPLVEFRLLNWTWDTEVKLQQGQIDIGINYSLMNLSKAIRQESVCQARFGFCCAKTSAFAKEGINYKTLSENPLVLMVMPDFYNNINFVEHVLEIEKIKPTVIFRSDLFDNCMAVLQSSDAGMPVSNFVSSILPSDIVMLPLPEDLPKPEADISLFYSNTYQTSLKLIWLRKMISEIILEMDQRYSS